MSEEIEAGLEDALSYAKGDATGSITHVSESNFLNNIDHFFEIAETGTVVIEKKWVLIPHQMYTEYRTIKLYQY